ncbi:MAG: hypothetical protein ACE5JL_08340 [Dehalococcoidia bacterium]
MGSSVEQTDKAAFDSTLEQLRINLLLAHSHLEILRALYAKPGNHTTMARYRGFFLPTLDAHFNQFCIRTSITVDRKYDDASFYKAFRIIENRPELAPGIDVNGLIRRVAKQKPLLKKIIRFRHTLAAHWKTGATVPRSFPALQDCSALLEELESIFKQIQGAYNGNPTEFKLGQAENTLTLLETIEKADTEFQ